MRYVGQDHDLQIDLPDSPVSAAGKAADFIDALSSSFANGYRAIFGRSPDAHPVEVLTSTMRATVEAGSSSGALPFQSAPGDTEPIGVTRLYDPDAGAVGGAPIYWRDLLPSGFVVEGPAVIPEEENEPRGLVPVPCVDKSPWPPGPDRQERDPGRLGVMR